MPITSAIAPKSLPYLRMAARVKRAAEREHPWEPVTSLIQALCPSSRGGRRDPWGASTLPIVAPPTLYGQKLLIRGPAGVELGVGLESKEYILETPKHGNGGPFLLCCQQGAPSAPQAKERPYLWGAEWINATLQGLAEAAVGLLHALHLEGKARKGRPAPGQGGQRSQPSPGPYFPAKLFATTIYLIPSHSHAVGGHGGLPLLKDQFSPQRPEKNAKLPRGPEDGARGRPGIHTTSLTPQPPPDHCSRLPTVPFAHPLLVLGPHLALEGDELGVEAAKCEVGKVRAPRHGGEALGAQVHALGRAPASSQRMVAVLRPLGLLLPRAGAGIQRPRGQRLPGKGEEVGGAEPEEGAVGGQGQSSSGTSPLSWGLQRPARPHSWLLVPLRAHRCLHRSQEGGEAEARAPQELSLPPPRASSSPHLSSLSFRPPSRRACLSITLVRLRVFFQE